MSRSYDMHLQLSGFDNKKLKAINKAIENEWNWEWPLDEYGSTSGESSLCGGETEEMFADRVARTVWGANGKYCEVEIQATYMEDLPHENHTRNRTDYKRLMRKHPRLVCTVCGEPIEHGDNDVWTHADNSRGADCEAIDHRNRKYNEKGDNLLPQEAE